MRALIWTVMGFTGTLLLAPTVRSAGPEKPVASKPVLEVMSPDPGDCSLGLTWQWGSMAVNHVLFDDHSGPFKAIVEPTGRGVRVTFNGWGEEPFVASADKQIRIVYQVGRKKEIDFYGGGGFDWRGPRPAGRQEDSRRQARRHWTR